MKNGKNLTIAMIVLVVLMVIAGGCILSYRYHSPGVTSGEIIILASYTFEMALFAMLYIQNSISKASDYRNEGSKNSAVRAGRYFPAILVVMIAKLFTDQLVYYANGNVQLIWLNWTAATLTYAFGIPLMLGFWIYCARQLDISKKEFWAITNTIVVLGIILIICYIINFFTGFLFYIDENGYFTLSSSYWVLMIQNVFCCIACPIAIFKSHIRLNKKIMLSVVFVITFVGVVLGIISADLNFLQYLFMTLAIFICYVSVYIRDEDNYNAKLRELDMAATIQRDALRSDFGDFRDHKIYAYMNPAREVGGDFYDFFDVDETTAGVLIADVSGKGIPAAMFMMQGLSAIRELASRGCPINEVFEKANNLLCAHNENEYFITAWMAYINKKTGDVVYVNAGHNPPIIKRSSGDAAYVKCKPGMVLAAMEGMPYRVNELRLEPGDTLFMYTDGLPEAQNVENELYGEDRMLDAACAADADPEKLADAMLKDINAFVGDAEQFDDMTIISYRRK